MKAFSHALRLPAGTPRARVPMIRSLRSPSLCASEPRGKAAVIRPQ